MNNKQYEDITDGRLVELLNGSDESAFTEIVDRYYTLLYSFAVRRLHNKDQAKDLVHDLFAALWKKRRTLILSEPLDVYLIKSIKPLAYNHFKELLREEKYIEMFAKFLEDRKNNCEYLIRHDDYEGLVKMEIAALPKEMMEKFEQKRSKGIL